MHHPIARLSLPSLAVLIGGALFILAGSARAAAPAQAFDVAPSASWVKPLPLPATTEAPANTDAAAGTLFLLLDEQVRATGKTVQRYTHQARKVLSTGGVDEASSLQIEFDPSYQKLTLHGVWRIRDG